MHAIVLRVHAKLNSEWEKSLGVNSYRFRVSAICKNSEIDENWFLCLSCTVVQNLYLRWLITKEKKNEINLEGYLKTTLKEATKSKTEKLSKIKFCFNQSGSSVFMFQRQKYIQKQQEVTK